MWWKLLQNLIEQGRIQAHRRAVKDDSLKSIMGWVEVIERCESQWRKARLRH